MAELQVIDRRSAALDAQPQLSPIQELQLRIIREGDLAKLKELREMEREWKADEARREFLDAMAAFKANPPAIIKNRTAKMQGIAKGSGREYELTITYADLEAVTTAIQEGLAKVGITHRFLTKQDDQRITVTCILSKGTHLEEGVTLWGPPDTGGAKNAIQAIGSTVSYLMRYTLLAATGMATGMPDSDGNITPQNQMSGEDRQNNLAAIKSATTVDDLKSAYQLAQKVAEKAKDKEATRVFAEAKNERYKELASAKNN